MSAEAIDRVLSAAQAAGVASGFVAAAKLPGGGEYAGVFGQRGVADPAAMTGDTLFWIASMTKALTSIAALQLVEQGRLTLDQDAGAILPAIGEAPILEGFDETGAPRLRPARRPLTVRHLLTHTSGFGYPFMSPELARYGAHAGLGVGDSLAMPRLFEAGERWQYGVSTDFVGQLVEQVSGLTLDVYLKRHVFDVLGMADTTFALSPEQAGRKAAMHARTPDGGLAPMPFAPPPPPNPMLGGGGLWSTAGDYLTFLKALLAGGVGAGGAILGGDSLALLTTNQVGELDCGVLTASIPMFTNDFEPMPGRTKRWSLGLMVNEEPGPDGRSAGSLAWAGLSNCYYWADPAAGAAGVLLMQIMPFADPKALEVFSAFEQAVYL
ncbi:MAG: serine hydrolase [Caulobacteraceae bacterium]|nr:serine hydrolase [Caulobacteraceae bacterium]